MTEKHNKRLNLDNNKSMPKQERQNTTWNCCLILMDENLYIWHFQDAGIHCFTWISIFFPRYFLEGRNFIPFYTLHVPFYDTYSNCLPSHLISSHPQDLTHAVDTQLLQYKTYSFYLQFSIKLSILHYYQYGIFAQILYTKPKTCIIFYIFYTFFIQWMSMDNGNKAKREMIFLNEWGKH